MAGSHDSRDGETDDARSRTAADQAFGAAAAFVEHMGTLAYHARAQDVDRIEASGERKPSSGWDGLGPTFAMAFIAWFDLQRMLTPELRRQVRRMYPPGAPPIKLGRARAKPTVIEAVADQLGINVRNSVYAGRSHPFEIDRSTFAEEAKARATARQVALGRPPEPLGWGQDVEELAREAEEALKARLRAMPWRDAFLLMSDEWKKLTPQQAAWAIETVQCGSLDFDDLKVLLDREAQAVLAAEERTREEEAMAPGAKAGTSGKVDETSPYGGDPFLRLAGVFEGIREAWGRGDSVMLDLAPSLGPETSGFQRLGRAARESVDQFLAVVDREIIPVCLPRCDPSLRDQIQRVIGLLRPDAILPDRYGEASARWRQTWEAMDLKAEFEDLIPKLRAAAEQNRCKEFTSAGSSAPILTAANAANDVNGLPAANKSRQKGKWPPLPEIGSSNDPQREVRERTLPRSLTAIGRVIEIKDYRTIEGMIQKGEIWAYRHSKKRWRLDYDQIDARWGRVAANLLV